MTGGLDEKDWEWKTSKAQNNLEKTLEVPGAPELDRVHRDRDDSIYSLPGRLGKGMLVTLFSSRRLGDNRELKAIMLPTTALVSESQEFSAAALRDVVAAEFFCTGDKPNSIPDALHGVQLPFVPIPDGSKHSFNYQ